MKVKRESELLSRVRLSATPWTAAYQAPPCMGFSRQEYWDGVPLPSPDGILPAIKTNEILSFATWIDLEGIRLGEISQRKTNIIYFHLCMDS